MATSKENQQKRDRMMQEAIVQIKETSAKIDRIITALENKGLLPREEKNE